MLKRIILLCLLLTLVACGATTAEPTTESPTLAALPPTAVVPTEAPAEPTTAIPVADATDALASSDEPAVEFPIEPATTVAEAAVVRPEDYVIGNPDAAVLVIEYGDFQ